MKALKAIKYMIGAATLVAVASAQAVVVDTSLWTTDRSPAYNLGPSGLTSAGGNQAVQNNNSYGTIVSDFSFTGDFNFSGTMTPTTASFDDNDILGLVFGWQDPSNHYRLGWEQGGFNDISGASGMFLVRELAGVSTILFQQEIFWADNVDYNFIVGRSGNDISFSLGGVSQSFTDTTFMSGNVGFYTESQTARFGGLASAPEAPGGEVSSPAPLALLGLGLVGLFAARKRSA
ncbi:hypothetical protein imdm_630 [gamma proteobacterium IMCC2047]|nr:hypothetical protein imdm_630 [gamma proteobacterium IMCC2047]